MSKQQVPTIPLKLYHDLEPLICDLKIIVDILFDQAQDKLTTRGAITLSGDEAERIYFLAAMAADKGEELKKVYYSEETP
ncbi:MAG: hypothetical protein DCC74_09025 [Proteobacteria bacterium]|nr:MAG: hypothetical protein DCC74_09025 [Pseudomonadota bacterium]